MNIMAAAERCLSFSHILFSWKCDNYEGCSKNNVTCIGAHIAEVLFFILICSALQNTLRQPEHTFLAGQSIFGSIFHTLQWGHPSDTDKQQIQGHFSNCISFQINDILVLERENSRRGPRLANTEGAEGR